MRSLTDVNPYKSTAPWGKLPAGQTPHAAPDTASRISKFAQDGTFMPHYLTLEPQGSLMVAGRENHRIQIIDQDENYLRKRGIRVGNLSDANVLYRIANALELKGTNAADGVAVDAKGNVYGGEVGPRSLVKHTRE
jgi:DNA-binding beta-propeller fold protein YncE